MPSLLLLPGLMCDASVWAPQVAALSPQAAGIWPHLAANVIPRALGDTALLLLGVGCVCGVGDDVAAGDHHSHVEVVAAGEVDRDDSVDTRAGR